MNSSAACFFLISSAKGHSVPSRILKKARIAVLLNEIKKNKRGELLLIPLFFYNISSIKYIVRIIVCISMYYDDIVIGMWCGFHRYVVWFS